MAKSSFSGPVVHSGKPTTTKQWFKDLPVSVMPDYCVLFDDFTGIALDSTNDWTVVKDTGAAVAIGADTLHGVITMTSTATTDNDGSSIQGNEVIAATADEDIWFECRIKSSDADDQDICVGLVENFATNPEAMLTSSNRICFQIDDGNASILCKTESSDTETSTDSAQDAADDTYVKLGIHVIGTGVVEFYVNRALVATHTTNIPTANLAPAVMQLSGSATGTKSATVDYVLVAQSR